MWFSGVLNSFHTCPKATQLLHILCLPQFSRLLEHWVSSTYQVPSSTRMCLNITWLELVLITPKEHQMHHKSLLTFHQLFYNYVQAKKCTGVPLQWACLISICLCKTVTAICEFKAVNSNLLFFLCLSRCTNWVPLFQGIEFWRPLPLYFPLNQPSNSQFESSLIEKDIMFKCM